MILHGFHVDGFGLHRDLRHDGFGPGLNVVAGPNEAGKSTLHAFLRGMLFGFRDRRTKEPVHEPVRGGVHGGRLVVLGDDGEYRIERWAAGKKRLEVRGPDGAGGQELLDRLLGGADARLFRGVFAFGLADLAGLEALSSEEVAAAIFDAGLAGEGRAAAAAIADLSARRAKELAPRSGRLRELGRELERLGKERRAAIEAARGHAALHARLAAETAALSEVRTRLVARRAEARRLALLRGAWSHEVRRREAEAVLALPADPVVVPADAPARFDALAGAVRQAEERLARADEGLARLRAARASARDTAGDGRPEVAALVADLGPGWTPARLRTVDRSPARREALVRRAEDHAAAREEARAARRERERADAALTRAREDLAAIDRVRPPSAPDRPSLDARREALATLRAARADAAAGSPAGRPSGPLLGIAVALAAAAVAAGLLAGPWAGAGWAVGAAVAAIAGFLLRGSARIDGARDAAVRAAAAALGLPPSPTAAELERAAIALEAELASAAAGEAWARQRDAAARAVAAARSESDRAGRDAATAAAREDACAAAWAAATADLPAGAVGRGPGGDPEPAGAVGPAAAARAGDGSAIGPVAATAILDRAGELARLDAASREADGALAGRIEAAGRERALLAAELAAERGRLAAMLAEAGAADRAGLVERAERAAARRTAVEALAAARRGIAGTLGDGPDGQALREALATGDLGGWEEDGRRAEDEVAALSAEVETRATALGALRRELAALEASADVPRLSGELAAAEAEVAEAIRRYRAAALTERLLREALEVYRRERQPAVLRRAGEAFAAITSGRYREVLQAGEPGKLEVLDRDGRLLPVSVLSRGTQEQLYVCVRLGLAATVAARGTRLPLLLDDVLVDFDPGRAAAAARVLADFARDHQVFLFTCHPATVALVQAAAPGTPVLHLPGGLDPGAAPGRTGREGGGEEA